MIYRRRFDVCVVKVIPFYDKIIYLLFRAGQRRRVEMGEQEGKAQVSIVIEVVVLQLHHIFRGYALHNLQPFRDPLVSEIFIAEIVNVVWIRVRALIDAANAGRCWGRYGYRELIC